MTKSEAQLRYDQHSVYLDNLLKKHERGEGLKYEDLQNSWKHVLKFCKDNQEEPLVSYNSYFHVFEPAKINTQSLTVTI